MLRATMRRARGDSDGGYSLGELAVVMAVFGLLMAITFSILLSITLQSRDSLARAQALQEMRLGIAQIDRQVRSGNLILDPADEDPDHADVAPFYSMRILTQEDGEFKCAQWRVIDHDLDGSGDLEFRTWDVGYPAGVVTEWSAVAHNLVDVGISPESQDDIDPSDPTTWPPFWVDQTASAYTEAQFVRITLRLKDPKQTDRTKPASVTTTVTGRNTIFNTPSTTCDDVPPA